MRILFIVPKLSGGGAENVAAQLASALSARHEVRLVCLAETTEAQYPLDERVQRIDLQRNGEISRLFGADAIMVTAGSCTGLPSQEVWRMTDELYPKAIVPMHYRFGNYGPRRLEHIENLINYFEAPEMIHYYDTDSIVIDENTEPQVAVLKYKG